MPAWKHQLMTGYCVLIVVWQDGPDFFALAAAVITTASFKDHRTSKLSSMFMSYAASVIGS